VTKVADNANVTAGQQIGFTITVTNIGVGDATGVVLSDPLPTNSGLSWSINPPVAGCSINAGVLTCNFGTLASGNSASVHIISPTTVATCGGTVFNTATATATNSPPNTPPASSGPVGIVVACPASCQPPFTPTTVLSGTINSPVVVTGNTVIQNATINASVTVQSGANVFINNSFIGGATNSNGAKSFYMFGTTAQNVSVTNTTGPVFIGNNGGTGQFGACTGNDLKSLDVTYNKGGVSVVNNKVAGSVAISNNISPSGPTLIKLNRIGGDLGCINNSPVATNGGGANTVGGRRSGQCLSPSF
jgi:uncharacterized repeat protein (TIGR01451 family)